MGNLSSQRKKILVAPLDWGLGHAARCVPVIREILSQGHEVITASDGRALVLLELEFPDITHVALKGYRPVYPAGNKMVAAMFFQTPKFLFAILREHFALQSLIDKHAVDGVISDNRYGLWTKRKPCVFITHQLFIRMPAGFKWLEKHVNRLNHFFIRRFLICWMPDVAGENNLSGALSHGEGMPENAHYIGMLTRLKNEATQIKYDLLVLLSGPEPQRTLLENILLQQLTGLPLRTLIVSGITEENKKTQLSEFITRVSNLPSGKLNECLLQSEFVICRAGYTSIMELVSINKPALLIPTPGQTEQEYLAERCAAQSLFITQRQDNINLQEALMELKKIKNKSSAFSDSGLKDAVTDFLKML